MEHLRLVMAEVQVATVHNQVALSLFTDFENFITFMPDPRHEMSLGGKLSLGGMLNQFIAWSGALKLLREKIAGQA